MRHSHILRLGKGVQSVSTEGNPHANKVNVRTSQAESLGKPKRETHSYTNDMLDAEVETRTSLQLARRDTYLLHFPLVLRNLRHVRAKDRAHLHVAVSNTNMKWDFGAGAKHVIFHDLEVNGVLERKTERTPTKEQ